MRTQSTRLRRRARTASLEAPAAPPANLRGSPDGATTTRHPLTAQRSAQSLEPNSGLARRGRSTPYTHTRTPTPTSAAARARYFEAAALRRAPVRVERAGSSARWRLSLIRYRLGLWARGQEVLVAIAVRFLE